MSRWTSRINTWRDDERARKTLICANGMTSPLEGTVGPAEKQNQSQIGPTLRTHYASGQVCTGTALPSEVFPDTAVREL